jgi:hypothetical protein
MHGLSYIAETATHMGSSRLCSGDRHSAPAPRGRKEGSSLKASGSEDSKRNFSAESRQTVILTNVLRQLILELAEDRSRTLWIRYWQIRRHLIEFPVLGVKAENAAPKYI